MSPSRTETRYAWCFGTAALIVAAVLLLIVLFLIKESWPVLHGSGWVRLFSGDGWYPASGQFNLLPMLVSTLAASIGALAVAGPLGVLIALCSVFYAPRWLIGPVRQIIGLLSGIPSVVYGFWGLIVLVPLVARYEPPGASLLTGIFILALMVLPTVALTSEAALRAVPATYLSGAAALGLSRRTIVLKVALVAARDGIVSGILLAVARSLGETMAVLMVTGNVAQMPTSFFDPVRVLTANIALEMAYATGNHRAGLFASGLLLMSIVAVLAWLASRSPEYARR